MWVTKAIRFFLRHRYHNNTYTRNNIKWKRNNIERFKCMMRLATVITTWIQIQKELNWKETNRLHHKQSERVHTKKAFCLKLIGQITTNWVCFPFIFRTESDLFFSYYSFSLPLCVCARVFATDSSIAVHKGLSFFSPSLTRNYSVVCFFLLLLVLFCLMHRLLLAQIFSLCRLFAFDWSFID